jgi:hypothetical protein
MNIELRNRLKINGSRPAHYWNVLMIYIMYSDKYGYCWLSQEKICEMTGIDLRNLKKRYISQLIKDGVFTKELSPTFKLNPSRPAPKTNCFRINMAFLPQESYPQPSVKMTLSHLASKRHNTQRQNDAMTQRQNDATKSIEDIYEEKSLINNFEENPKTISVAQVELAKMKSRFTNGKGQ